MIVHSGLATWARFVDGFSVATIGTRFSYVAGGVEHAGIPRMPPAFEFPWLFPAPDGRPLKPGPGGPITRTPTPISSDR